MGSVWLSLRAGFRSRWRGLAGLALLLGLIGGVALTAAAGARRTDTAYPRLLRWSNAASILVVPNGTGLTGYYRALAGIPQASSMWTSILYNMALPARSGPPDEQVNVSASPGGSQGTSIDRVRILQGRLFARGATREVMVDQQLANLEHLRPGSTLHLLGIPQSGGNPDVSHAVPLAFRVTAVVAFDDQIVPATTANGEPRALLSPGYSPTASAREFATADDAGVRIAPGASPAALIRAARALAARYPATGGNLDIINLADESAATERAIGPEAIALAIFASVAGLIGLAIIGQLLSRQLILDSAEFPILRALGMTSARLLALSLARMAAVTVTGGAIAVAVAVAASPLMPIGPARLAEPSPGVEVNLAILAGGFAAIALLPLALVGYAARRAAAKPHGPLSATDALTPRRSSRLGPAFGLTGSVTGGIGVRMAFDPGRGGTAVPVRSALAATAAAIAAVVAALVFGTSLIHLVSTPRLYGQNWDERLDLGFGTATATFPDRFIPTQRALTGYAYGNYGQVSIGGRTVPAIGIDQVRGRGFLTLLAGRPPSGDDEIVLGAQTMRAVHSQLGQTVRVTVNGAARGMRIVGVAVFASFSRGGFSATDLGSGAAVNAAVLSVPSPSNGCHPGSVCYNFFLLRYRPGTGLPAAAASLEGTLTRHGCPPGFCLIGADQRPADIQHYTAIRDTPLVLGAVLALLAVGTLAHVLLTGVQRRRRDLAVLKTLGLLRSQVIMVLSWQASALATAALLIGLPLGVVAGRWSWALFARSIGVAGQADVPTPLVLLAIPVALLLANLIGAGPGWAAARIRPALILRSE